MTTNEPSSCSSCKSYILHFFQNLKTKKRISLIIIFILVFILICSLFIWQKSQNKHRLSPLAAQKFSAPHIKGQIIIKTKNGVSDQAIGALLDNYHAKIIKKIGAINRLIIQVPRDKEEEIYSELIGDSLIENAEPDYIVHAFYVPNDPYLNLQWGLANSGQIVKGLQGTSHADINVESAWDIAKGSGVKIAILDSGIDTSHPDLSSKIIGTYDLIGIGINDDFGHGTHTAGIVAALTNNSIGISGICPDCRLLIVKVLDSRGVGSSSNIANGIIWAADNGAKVINMSFGSTTDSLAEQDAINYAWNKNVVSVAAVGNTSNTQKNYPAADAHVVSVAAVDNNDTLCSFSTYGTWVSVAAPGRGIYSTFPMSSYYLQKSISGLKSGYDYLDGTSMSTPMVSGVLGLIWSSSYGTSAQAVVQRLYSTSEKIQGTGTYWIYGRINASKAVGGLTSTPTPKNTSTPTPTFTVTPTNTPTPTLTSTPTPTPTVISLITPTPTFTVTPTNTPTPTLTSTPTPTPVIISASPTPTPVIISASPTPTPTANPFPTIYCLGACPTPTSAVSPKITQKPLLTPSATPFVVTPTPAQSTGPENIIGWIIGLLNSLLELLLKMIQ